MAEGVPVRLVVVGTNHRHAPIGVRERLAAHHHGQVLLDDLMRHAAVAEAVGLSTCNRCELYMVGSDVEAMRSAAVARLAAYSHQGAGDLDPLLYVHQDDAAAEHLFAVAGGLDSLVPGEAQILAQIRDAHAAAAQSGAAGPVSHRLFDAAVEAGKRIRHETAIGRGGASVASVAAELARERLGGLDEVTVLVIGAGKIAELAAVNLRARGARSILVVNRSPDRAEQVAAQVGGQALPLSELASALALADVVVSSTGAAEHLIAAADVPPGPRVLIDLAVPRDIEPAAGELDGVALFHVDDLEDTVRRTILRREGEAGRAMAIVREQSHEFRGWVAALEVVPAITSLRTLAEQIRIAELERAEGRWEALTDADRERLDAITRSMMAKLLHRPTVRLKELAAERESEPYTHAVTELFGL
ncbi:MAG TPA: glutamyl-tRNA reductase [Gaiellales bacterium]|nr:glutamyl-tRNA reductase [Gaiellales bacterium]